jgi:hypothetical protein
LRPTSVHCVHHDHGREVAGAHTGHTAASTTRALTGRAVATCRVCATNGVRTLTPLNQRSTEGSVGPTEVSRAVCTFRPGLLPRRGESCVTKDRRIEPGDLELPPGTLRAGRKPASPQVDLSHVDHQSPPIRDELQRGEADRRLAHFLSASRQRGQLPVRPERQDVQKITVPATWPSWRAYQAMSGLTFNRLDFIVPVSGE